MKSVYNFVVTPVGERYNNNKKVEGGDLILNTEIYNHQFINRIAKVISTPIIGDTDIKTGDEVIIHHNVFRRWHNVRGIEKNSKSYFDENTYLVNYDQIFLVKYCNSFNDHNWYAPKGYCFVKPIKAKKQFENEYIQNVKTTSKEQPLIGIVKYSDGTVREGDLIGFPPRIKYEIVIDGERLYRIQSNLITIKYEHQENEEEYNPSWADSS